MLHVLQTWPRLHSYWLLFRRLEWFTFLRFLTFHNHIKSFTKYSAWKGHRNTNCSKLAITTLVYTSETHNRKIHYLTPQEGYAESTVPSGDKTPVSQPVDAASLLGRWKSLNLDPQVREILLNSWAEGSKAQYLSYLRRWATFCSENNINQTKTSL